jgi:hypothetical protein
VTLNEACVGSSLNHAADGGEAGLHSSLHYLMKNAMRKPIVRANFASFDAGRLVCMEAVKFDRQLPAPETTSTRIDVNKSAILIDTNPATLQIHCKPAH